MSCATAWPARARPATCCCPRSTLSALFPLPAARFIGQRGGAVHSGRRIESLRREGDAWMLDDAGPFRQVVLAIAPYHLATLVPELAQGVAEFDWEPIVTSYFRYPPLCDFRGPCSAWTPGWRNGCSTAARCAGKTG
jgi:hypothetical protein